MPLHTPTLLRAICAAIVFLAMPVVAGAQIYVWRDAAGNLVLSDRAKDPSAATYGVATSGSVSPEGSVRTTRPISRRAAQYQTLIDEHASLHTINPDLVRAVIQAESAYNPSARSPKGAMGLMQLMPATAAELGVRDAYDPAQNIRGGVAYLRQLLDRYGGNEELALAAYNAGPGAVQKYGGTVPPYRETRNYVAKVRKSVAAAAAASPAPPPRHVFRTVEIVGGREVVRYTGTPREGSEPVSEAQRR